MSNRNVIVIAVDRLGAGFLGPYGATWLDTPALNHLASQSLLIEHALADSPDLVRVYRSLWTGRHALAADIETPTLPQALSAAGWQGVLATDDAALAAHPLAAGFSDVRFMPRSDAADAAPRVEDTQLARVFSAASELLVQLKPPFFLWIHAEGMNGLWDAPWELRAQFADDDEPQPPAFTEPPQQVLPEGYDPDALLGVIHAYAGQVAALDRCLGAFLSDFLESEHAETTLLAFMSPRGYPLGEHRRIGPVDESLYGELLRIPLMLRFPNGAGAMYRAQAIVQPPDFAATLADWLGVSSSLQKMWGRSLMALAHEECWPRDRAVAAHGGERAIRTSSWFLRRHPAGQSQGESPQVELYVKPDDQWEVNEVANRAPDVVEELSAALEHFEQAIVANDEALLAPLSEGVV